MSLGFLYFIAGLFPLAFIIAFSALEVAIAFIQAIVFVILTCSYIKDGLDLHSSDTSSNKNIISSVKSSSSNKITNSLRVNPNKPTVNTSGRRSYSTLSSTRTSGDGNEVMRSPDLDANYSSKFNNAAVNTNKLNLDALGDKEFKEWFVGFADAESSFNIVPKREKGYVNRFSFMFVIGLHQDDLDALKSIQTNLNIGHVRVNKDECKFVVSDKEGIKKLIDIFDKYTLNTTWRPNGVWPPLDYLDFKKAFNLYYGREGYLTEELKDQIEKFQGGMNTMRTNFNMPKYHEINITKN